MQSQSRVFEKAVGFRAKIKICDAHAPRGIRTVLYFRNFS